MGHYDGKEFEKILQEAQANMMKGIPSLEVEENPSLTPDATAEQAAIHNPVESPTGAHLTPLRHRHGLHTFDIVLLHEHMLNMSPYIISSLFICMTEEPQSEPQSDKPAKKGPEKLPKPVMEKPSKPALERPPKTATKPAPPDSSTKQGSEKSSKSPPPPPPRKTYSSSSSGMTTTRSGEVVFTGRKESVSPQVSPIFFFVSDKR